MHLTRRLLKPFCSVLIALFLSMTLPIPAAQAALVGTLSALQAEQAAAQRTHIAQILQRTEVQNALAARGVTAEEVQARVAGLNDEEVAQLAAQLDQAPAGGDALGVVVLIFLVLLITDILGFTDVFPFVKKHAR